MEAGFEVFLVKILKSHADPDACSLELLCIPPNGACIIIQSYLLACPCCEDSANEDMKHTLLVDNRGNEQNQ